MRYIIATLALIVFGVLLWLLQDIVLLFLTGVLIAVVISIPVEQLTRLGLSWKVSTTITILFIVVILIIIGIFSLPVIVEQSEVFLNKTLPNNINAMQSDILKNQFDIAEDIPLVSAEDIRGTVQEFGNSISEYFWRFSQRILPIVGRVTGIAVGLIFLVFIVIYLLLDPKKYYNGFMQLISEDRQPRIAKILKELYSLLKQWIGATLFSMLLMAIASYISYRLLGLPQAVLLGLITGLASFIPNLGPIAALILAMIAGISGSETSLILIPIVIYGLTFLQNQVLNPYLMSQTLDLPPLTVLGGQLIAGVMFGFVGLVLAVPMTIITMLLVRELYVKDFLGNHASVEAVVDDEYLPLQSDHDS